MNYEIVEFIVNNRDVINVHISEEIAPALIAARIFQNNSDLYHDFLDHKQLMILRKYIAMHFTALTPEELLTQIDYDLLEHLKEK